MFDRWRRISFQTLRFMAASSFNQSHAKPQAQIRSPEAGTGQIFVSDLENRFPNPNKMDYGRVFQ
jgi:hypothetical protein